MEKIDWQAVWAWAKNPDRKPPELAFTAGPERKAADIAWFVTLREREKRGCSHTKAEVEKMWYEAHGVKHPRECVDIDLGSDL